MPLENVSAVIITKNAGATLRDTLISLKAFDEVVIYDNGSNDDTIGIAAEFENVSLHTGEFLGFGRTKSHAVSLARHDWVLSIDADETVSDDLRQSLLGASRDDPDTAYQVNRHNYFMGKLVRHSGWGNDWLLRLFNRTHHGFNDAAVHEQVVLGAGGNIDRLTGALKHDAVRDIGQFLVKINRYSELRRQSARTTLPLPVIVLRSWFAFIRCYVLQLGFLDGWRGFVIARANAIGTFFKYMKW